MDRWKTDSEKYSESQIISVLSDINIEIVGDTRTNYLCLCPFHENDNTPALSVSIETGLFMCFNPSCGESGNLIQLIRKKTGLDYFPALRLIAKYKNSDYVASRRSLDLTKDVFPTFNQAVLNDMYDNYWGSIEAQTYMKSRKFSDSTMEFFKVGYSKKRELIAVPMHDKKGNPVGVIGRSIKEKRFDNSVGLPTSRTLFNLHRALRSGDEVIVVEASFDAMRAHQAGFPCVVALCMGTLSPYHIELLDMYFDKIVIATDFDDYNKYKRENCTKCKGLCKGHNPGRMLGHQISEKLGHKRIKWASHSYGMIYPSGAKDYGDMSDDDIRLTIENSVTNFEYNRWKKFLPELAIL